VSRKIILHQSQFTSLGPLTYRRTYFKTPDGNSYLLDKILRVNQYERIDTSVSAAMVNHAGAASFGRSAYEVTGGQVSRQTAWRKAMEIGEVALVPGRAEKQPESLHIFADEAHVHLQNGKGAMLPLVTICTGKKAAGSKRNKLNDAVHVNGFRLEPDKYWDYVYAICEAKYDMGKVKTVFIYGDGAAWIGKALEYFPGAIFVLDDYHYQKRMTTLTAREICKGYAKELRSAVRYNKKEKFEAILHEMEAAVTAGTEDEKKRTKLLDRLKKDGGYLIRHWDAIQNRGHSGAIGSCTEAMVSHVFSERFSRSPMGWTEPGLDKMTMIRTYQKNGCKIMPSDISLDKRTGKKQQIPQGYIGKYESLAKEQAAAVFKDIKSWKWLNGEVSMLSQARTGTRHAIRSLGKMRNIS